MVVVGLTGGIATGKSTVAAVFEEAGARRIDADRIARDVVREGLPAYRDIVAHFGPQVLQEDGALDRRRLAAIVFRNAEERRALERIVHPQVRKETALRLERIRQESPEAVVVMEVPLLFECGMDRGLDATVVVAAPEEAQIERLMARDGLGRAEALARIRSQMPLEAKKALATHVIDNSGPVEHTRAQALALYRRFAAQAQGGGRRS